MIDAHYTSPPISTHFAPWSEALRRNFYLLTVALCAILVFAGYYTKIQNMFYGTGAYFLDTGWYAYLLSDFRIPAGNPRTFMEEGVPSYFAYHLALIMPLWGALADVFGWTPPQAMGAYQGVTHVALMFGGIALGRAVATRHQQWVGLAIGLFLAFSPIMLDAMGFPHTEPTMAVLIILTLTCIATGARRLAILFFLLCMSVREDAGFHFAAFLLCYIALDWLQERRLERSKPLLVWCGAAIALSIVGFIAKAVFFPQVSTLHSVYIGDGFSHLSFQVLLSRAWNITNVRPELFVLFAIPVVSALLTRRLADLAGLVAIGPWVLLNLIALNPAPTRLESYYAFPILVTQAWPFVRTLLDMRGWDAVRARLMPPWATRSFFLLSTLALVVFFTVPMGDAGVRIARGFFFAAFRPQVTQTQIDTVRHFHQAVERDLPGQPRLLIDDGMLSLVPLAPRANRFQTADRVAIISDSAPHGVVFFRNYLEAPAIRETFAARPDAQCYVLPGADIGAVFNAPPAEMAPNGATFLQPYPCALL